MAHAASCIIAASMTKAPARTEYRVWTAALEKEEETSGLLLSCIRGVCVGGGVTTVALHPFGFLFCAQHPTASHGIPRHPTAESRRTNEPAGRADFSDLARSQSVDFFSESGTNSQATLMMQASWGGKQNFAAHILRCNSENYLGPSSGKFPSVSNLSSHLSRGYVFPCFRQVVAPVHFLVTCQQLPMPSTRTRRFLHDHACLSFLS